MPRSYTRYRSPRRLMGGDKKYKIKIYFTPINFGKVKSKPYHNQQEFETYWNNKMHLGFGDEAKWSDDKVTVKTDNHNIIYFLYHTFVEQMFKADYVEVKPLEIEGTNFPPRYESDLLRFGGGGFPPYEALHVATIAGEKIYRLDRPHYGKPAGTLFILKSVSKGENGRHLKHVYRQNWPRGLKEAANHLV